MSALFTNLPYSVAALKLYGTYLKQGETHKAQVYKPFEGVNGGGANSEFNAQMVRYLYVYNSMDVICVLTVLRNSVCEENADYRQSEMAIPSQDGYRQALLYSGATADQINIAYRAHSNDLQRQTVSNDVEYDLSDSAIIRYKNAQLEILEATNELVGYRVIHGFD